MQQIMGYIRRAVTEYEMIVPGDAIAVGVSGGKDSLALLAGLAGVRRYIGIPFTLTALCLDNGFPGVQTDYTPLEAFCEEIEVPLVLKRTTIGEIVFATRQETNPCSLCARMRRGALHDLANAAGCNKIALGHHMDDAVETFMMNLFNGGRAECFSPVSYLSRKDITMIRPLIFAPEAEIRRAVRRAKLPVTKNPCPADGNTQREKMKQLIASLDADYTNLSKKIFGALRRDHISGW